MTNVWITSPWTKLITNFLILTCKNAMEFGCSLSLSFLKFLKFANILISSEYCSRKLECALCTMWVSFCYPAPSPARPWECQPLRLTRCSQSLHNRLLLRGQPVQRWGGWGALYQLQIQLQTTKSVCSGLQRDTSVNQRAKPHICTHVREEFGD